MLLCNAMQEEDDEERGSSSKSTGRLANAVWLGEEDGAKNVRRRRLRRPPGKFRFFSLFRDFF